MSGKKYTEENKQWLIANAASHKYKSWQEVFEAYDIIFHDGRNASMIKDLCSKRLGISRKNINEGQFVIGKKPKYKIGDEVKKTVKDISYTWVKVDDKYFVGKCSMKNYKENWVEKQRYIYEKEKEEIPEGYIVIFLDRDRENFAIENLYAIPRSIHSTMCKNRWYSDNPVFTLCAIKFLELYQYVKEEQ